MPNEYPAFTFRLSQELRERLDEVATEQRESQAALVRRALRELLDELGGDGARTATPSH